MSDSLNAAWAENTTYFEYTSAANPRMPKIEIEAFPASMHQIDDTRIIPLDLSSHLDTPYPCTGPSLLANFVHINSGESLTTDCSSASQVFFCWNWIIRLHDVAPKIMMEKMIQIKIQRAVTISPKRC